VANDVRRINHGPEGTHSQPASGPQTGSCGETGYLLFARGSRRGRRLRVWAPALQFARQNEFFLPLTLKNASTIVKLRSSVREEGFHVGKDLLCVAAVFAAFSIARAQDPTPAPSASPARPKFEVASIKECEGRVQSPHDISSSGRLRLGCWPLWRLISDAYETFASGEVDPLKPLYAPPPEGTVPNWVNSARYTIDAKAEGPQSGAMMRGPMMQSLLEERFQLKVHRETREIAGYVMTVDKGGLKLKPAQEGSCDRVDPTDLDQSPPARPCNVPLMSRNGPLTVLDFRGASLDVFSRFIRPDGRPVIDQTGLMGAFDIHLEWEPAVANSPAADSGAASDPSPQASAIEAMRRQLGLRLDPGKGTRELLVIDRVEKPSAN
jgi:uncharacterized protein (TIGR03435 family)